MHPFKCIIIPGSDTLTCIQYNFTSTSSQIETSHPQVPKNWIQRNYTRANVLPDNLQPDNDDNYDGDENVNDALALLKTKLWLEDKKKGIPLRNIHAYNLLILYINQLADLFPPSSC